MICRQDSLHTIVGFLEEIGLPVKLAPVGEPTFLPGLRIESGGLLIDPESLQQPGDALHEAGHLAVMEPHGRFSAGGDMKFDAGEEMAAIAWSYAAAVHLQIDPAVVFHADGYRGGSEAILENFRLGRYVGVPLLQWMGMTVDYPKMLRWLR